MTTSMAGVWFRLAAAALTAAAASGAARAGDVEPAAKTKFKTVGSSVAYGGPTQIYVMCVITNLRDGKLQVRDLKVFDESGAKVDRVASTCPSDDFKMVPRGACTITARAASDRAYGCSARVPTPADLKGRVELLESESQGPLSAEPME